MWVLIVIVNSSLLLDALAIYLLNLFLAFLQPKFDYSLRTDILSDEIEEGLVRDADDGTAISLLQQDDEFRPFVRKLPEWNFWCVPFPCFWLHCSAVCSASASWRPIAHICPCFVLFCVNSVCSLFFPISELNKWIFYRLSAIRAIVVSLSCTFFAAFDIPVYWPILVVYFFVLFALTMRRQIQWVSSRPLFGHLFLQIWIFYFHYILHLFALCYLRLFIHWLSWCYCFTSGTW